MTAFTAFMKMSNDCGFGIFMSYEDGRNADERFLTNRIENVYLRTSPQPDSGAEDLNSKGCHLHGWILCARFLHDSA